VIAGLFLLVELVAAQRGEALDKLRACVGGGAAGAAGLDDDCWRGLGRRPAAAAGLSSAS
jgi:hypothetical protein